MDILLDLLFSWKENSKEKRKSRETVSPDPAPSLAVFLGIYINLFKMYIIQGSLF